MRRSSSGWACAVKQSDYRIGTPVPEGAGVLVLDGRSECNFPDTAFRTNVVFQADPKHPVGQSNSLLFACNHTRIGVGGE